MFCDVKGLTSFEPPNGRESRRVPRAPPQVGGAVRALRGGTGAGTGAKRVRRGCAQHTRLKTAFAQAATKAEHLQTPAQYAPAI